MFFKELIYLLTYQPSNRVFVDSTTSSLTQSSHLFLFRAILVVRFWSIRATYLPEDFGQFRFLYVPCSHIGPPIDLGMFLSKVPNKNSCLIFSDQVSQPDMTMWDGADKCFVDANFCVLAYK